MYKVKRKKIKIIETGSFKLDGGAMMGSVPKVLWAEANPPDELNRIQLAMRCLLLDDGKNVILISDRNHPAKAAIMEAIPAVKVLYPREKGFLYVTDIQGKMEAERENWVILESNDPFCRCGARAPHVFVQGRYQCQSCGSNIKDFCQGEMCEAKTHHYGH